ncbi:MAG: hypothetical protein K9H25_19325 [Rhodospirillum sp.]|nr:hypothetical protein [Rhodospirillum sp.]
MSNDDRGGAQAVPHGGGRGDGGSRRTRHHPAPAKASPALARVDYPGQRLANLADLRVDDLIHGRLSNVMS